MHVNLLLSLGKVCASDRRPLPCLTDIDSPVTRKPISLEPNPAPTTEDYENIRIFCVILAKAAETREEREEYVLKSLDRSRQEVFRLRELADKTGTLLSNYASGGTSKMLRKVAADAASTLFDVAVSQVKGVDVELDDEDSDTEIGRLITEELGLLEEESEGL